MKDFTSIVIVLVSLFLGSVVCMISDSGCLTVGNDALQDVISRLEYLETRDKQHQRDNEILRHQLASYREEIVSLKEENHKLVERVFAVETINEEIITRLDILATYLKTEKESDQTVVDQNKTKPSLQDPFRPRVRRAENEGTVAFYVSLSNNIQHLGANQNIVFDHVITNLGNAYNVHVGDFRAPFGGTYVFSVTLTTFANHSNHYRFMKSGVSFGQLYNRGTEAPFASASLTTIVQLKAGDTVSITNVEPDEKLYGSHFSAFSGFLLQQDFTYPLIVG